MRRFFPPAFAVLLQATAFCQQTPSSTASQVRASSKPADANVVYAGPGVAAPVLISAGAPVVRTRRCTSIDGTAAIGAVIEADGTPRHVYILRNKMPDLDWLAAQIIAADRFRPGTYNNEPADVAVSVQVTMEACLKESRTADGTEIGMPQLRKPPMQTVQLLPAPPQKGSFAFDPSKPAVHISPPVPLNRVEAEYSEYGRKKRISGICLVQAMIDVNGIPQDVRVEKSLEPSMDEKAVEAVKQYRFKPAMKDGITPVPVMITIAVNFRLRKSWF